MSNELFNAVLEADLTKVTELLAAGADPDNHKRDARNPLLAAVCGSTDPEKQAALMAITKQLVEAGATLRRYDEEADSEPFLNCLQHKNHEAALYLIEAGVLDCAVEYPDDEDDEEDFEDDLYDDGEYHETPMAAAIKAGFLDIVKVLYEHSKDIYAIDEKNMLILAAEQGKLPIVQYALTIDEIDINEDDMSRGMTALHHVVDGYFDWEARTEIVKLLLDAGIDPTTENVDGDTALDMIEGSTAEGAQEIISLLKA